MYRIRRNSYSSFEFAVQIGPQQDPERNKFGSCWFPVLRLHLLRVVFNITHHPRPIFHPEVMATAAVEEIRATSYVGFDSITNQIEHKLLKRGFQFNVIVVGGFDMVLWLSSYLRG